MKKRFFTITPPKKDGLCDIYLRIQKRNPHIIVTQKTGLRCTLTIWDNLDNPEFMAKYADKEVKDLLLSMQDIQRAIEVKIINGISMQAEEVRKLVNSIVYRKKIEEERLAQKLRSKEEKDAKKITFSEYFKMYLDEAASGLRLTEHGVRYSKGTLSSIKQALFHYLEYENFIGKKLKFNEINLDFRDKYIAFLNEREYAINTIGKNINWIITVMFSAKSKGYHKSSDFEGRMFKGPRVEVDTIYLTIDDLNKIRAVDLSMLPIGYTYARVLFFVGVWTAQRVSDYNNITRDCIKINTREVKVEVPDPANHDRTIVSVEKREDVFIEIEQKKTCARVIIPCSTELKTILTQYNYNLPHIAEQKINRYMKEISRMAGLTETVMISSIRGGKKCVEWIPKYKLVHTHTARRTGATLMYLHGIDVYDIMKITGHTSSVTLKKYIKANNLEVATKMKEKYDYFD